MLSAKSSGQFFDIISSLNVKVIHFHCKLFGKILKSAKHLELAHVNILLYFFGEFFFTHNLINLAKLDHTNMSYNLVFLLNLMSRALFRVT